MVVRKFVNDEKLLFNDFIDEKEANGLSKETIKDYIETYALFVKDIGDSISKENVYKWIKLLVNKGISTISVNHYLCHLRVFVYWLINNGHLEKFELKKLKVQEPQLKVVNDTNLSILLKHPDITNSSYVCYRTWVIICFIMGTGARASTITNIKIEDIDFINKEIRYTHLKNKTIAIVPLSSSLEKILKHYLNIWDIGDNYLFPDKYGGQLTVNALKHSLRKYCIDRGVKPTGAHSFRHTFSKKYIINGGNVFSLQRMLTHTDLTMTKKYVHLFNSDLKIGYEEICPLNTYQKQPTTIKKHI